MPSVPKKCNGCSLFRRQGFFCSALCSEELAKLAGHSRTKTLKRGQFVNPKDSGLWPIIGIADGIIGVRRIQADGRGTIAAFFLSGDIVDLRGAPKAMYTGLCALSDTDVCHLSPGVFDEILGANPDARKIAWGSLQLQTFRLVEHSAELAKRQAVEKIAWFISEFRALHRIDGGNANSVSFRMPFRQIDLADYLGMQPETVSRALRILRARGIIRPGPRSVIEILDPEALDQIALSGDVPPAPLPEEQEFRVLQAI